MFEIGSRLKLTTGAFSLLALLVLGYSGVKLSLLYDTPLTGVSSESKLAKIKWNRLETIVSDRERTDWSKSVDLLIRDIPQPKPNIEKKISSQEIQRVVRYNSEILPEITGIIVTSDSFGKSTASVMIKGNIYTLNDEVSGYMIRKITKKGVSLTKNGRHYFIDAPSPSYSVDRGD